MPPTVNPSMWIYHHFIKQTDDCNWGRPVHDGTGFWVAHIWTQRRPILQAFLLFYKINCAMKFKQYFQFFSCKRKLILLSISVITLKIHYISKAGLLKFVTCEIITKTLYFQSTVPSFSCLGCRHVCSVISVMGGHSINSVCQVWSVVSLVLEMGVAHVTNPACIRIHSLNDRLSSPDATM